MEEKRRRNKDNKEMKFEEVEKGKGGTRRIRKRSKSRARMKKRGTRRIRKKRKKINDKEKE